MMFLMYVIKIPKRLDITVIARASAEFPPASCVLAIQILS